MIAPGTVECGSHAVEPFLGVSRHINQYTGRTSAICDRRPRQQLCNVAIETHGISVNELFAPARTPDIVDQSLTEDLATGGTAERQGLDHQQPAADSQIDLEPALQACARVENGLLRQPVEPSSCLRC